MQYHFLSEDNIEKIHLESLRILAEVGIRYHSNIALKHLERAGAIIDYQNSVARRPGAQF